MERNSKLKWAANCYASYKVRATGKPWSEYSAGEDPSASHVERMASRRKYLRMLWQRAIMSVKQSVAVLSLGNLQQPAHIYNHNTICDDEKGIICTWTYIRLTFIMAEWHTLPPYSCDHDLPRYITWPSTPCELRTKCHWDDASKQVGE